MGKPKFRISCRDADWLGETDRSSLARVSYDGEIKILQLDPLTYEDVIVILSELLPEGNPADFVREAVDRNIEGLLYNPQTLTLLAEVVGPKGNDWPKSRLALFERATLKLAEEHNQEHDTFGPSITGIEKTKIAGQLCTLLLVTGKAGVSVNRHSQEDEKYVPLLQVADNLSPNHRVALSTKIFHSEGEDHFFPIHRQVAEFLAGRHLATLIEEGLPYRRALSLITGNDGIVVSELRGVAAWLAAFSRDVRSFLIEGDPYSISTYGDISGFSTQDKEKLLESLHRDISGFGYPSRADSQAFGPIVVSELAQHLREYLIDSGRDMASQMFVVFLLEIMRGAPPVPVLFDTLVELVKDNTRSPLVRRRGIEVIIASYEPNETRTETLMEIVEDIRIGSIDDPDLDLLGITLYELYPSQISPQQVWKYLVPVPNEFYLGSFRLFWERRIIELSSSERDVLFSLLDSLFENDSRVHRLLRQNNLEHLPAGLLAQAVRDHGDSIQSRQMYDWLSIPGLQAHRSAESLGQLIQWLSAHPHIQKDITLLSLSEHDSGKNYDQRRWVINHMLKTSPPDDLGYWCLTQAMDSPNSAMANELLAQATGTLINGKGNSGLSIDTLFETVENVPDLKAALKPLLECHISQEYLERKKQYLDDSDSSEITQESQLLQEVHSQTLALRSGSAPLHLLWRLGNEYLIRNEDLAELLGNDVSLIEAALEGLVGILQRDDIPDVERIILAATESRSFCVSVSYIAGIAELGKNNPEQLEALTDDQIEKALAFFYCDPVEDRNVNWYQWCVREKPEIVTAILERCADAGINAGLKHIPGIPMLALDDNHSVIAASTSVSLLKRFPDNLSQDKVPGLSLLLRAAVRHADKNELLQLIREKTSLRTVDSLQRVHWLAAGALLAPEEYLNSLQEYCAGVQERVRELNTALSLGSDSLLDATQELAQMPNCQHVNILTTIIDLLGSHYSPVQFKGGRVSQDIDTQRSIGNLIQELASFPEESAGQSLRNLEARQDMVEWRLHLEDAKKAKTLSCATQLTHIQKLPKC